MAARQPAGLLRELGSFQILFITLSGIIGIGFATHSGEVLAISGPGGVLIAFTVVGIIAISVSEGICEMIVLWPISNAMIEFVRAFVDPDLAIVVGIAYWYTNAITLAALIIGAADLLSFWDISFPLLNLTFALFLGTIFIINSRGIKVFGWIELVGGVIKVSLVLTIFILMILIHTGALGNAGNLGSTFFDDGIRNNPNVATSHFTAVLVSIPLAIFSYIGIESVTVAAFEAKDPTVSLRFPARNIAYIVMAFYILSVGGFIANIEWFNQSLPQFFGQSLVSTRSTDLGHVPFWPIRPMPSTAAPVIAALQVGIAGLPGALTGFLVYSGLSAANTALYLATRTLYGLTRDINQKDRPIVVKLFAKLNFVTSSTHIPVWSLIVTVAAFSVQETLVAIGSVGCLLVWGSQCLAFIRLSEHRAHLVGDPMEKFQRWPLPPGAFSSYCSSIQPLPAYFGLISCLLLVFVLNAVSMFNGDQLLFKALTIYLGPGILATIFIILKLRNRRGYVKLGDWPELHDTLTSLNDLIQAPANILVAQGEGDDNDNEAIDAILPPAIQLPPAPHPAHRSSTPPPPSALQPYGYPASPPGLSLPPSVSQINALNNQQGSHDSRTSSPFSQNQGGDQWPVSPGGSDDYFPTGHRGSAVSPENPSADLHKHP
ncbi:hypothetical protein G7Y89_g11263 [Cudoniella acicularis]|uniref:Amino acid permease/ SLC12A domain-containing protein n=1 Tax=Cudoniella acicularis TaxID=354080 RepID=A0A8H4RCP1_9HELO|nr:hypothetical protein G7Y89_g11263 [Cudoniella acicularis]